MSGDNPEVDLVAKGSTQLQRPPKNPLLVPSDTSTAPKVPPKIKPIPNPKPKPKAVPRPNTSPLEGIPNPGLNAYLRSFLKEREKQERLARNLETRIDVQGNGSPNRARVITQQVDLQTNGNGSETIDNEIVADEGDQTGNSINDLKIEWITLIDGTDASDKSGHSNNDSKPNDSLSNTHSNTDSEYQDDDNSIYDMVTFKNGRPEMFVPIIRRVPPSNSTFPLQEEGCTVSMPEIRLPKSMEFDSISMYQSYFRNSTQDVPLYQNVMKTVPEIVCSDELIYCDMTKAGRSRNPDDDDGVYMTMTKSCLTKKPGEALGKGDESLYTSMMSNSICGSSVSTYYQESENAYERVSDVRLTREEPTRQVNPILKFGWQHLHEVTISGVLSKLSVKEIGLQEAKYELITSKVSYLKSLSILQTVFMDSNELRNMLTGDEWEKLFQCIEPIKRCSEHFLADLLSGWPKDLFLTNILKIVNQYAESGFRIYVDYCSKKIDMDYTVNRIRLQNSAAHAQISRLECDEICGNHTLESFLVLPIQRITRFPLLVGEIVRRLPETDEEYGSWIVCWEKLKQMAIECNEAVRKAESLRGAKVEPPVSKEAIDKKQAAIKKPSNDKKTLWQLFSTLEKRPK